MRLKNFSDRFLTSLILLPTSFFLVYYNNLTFLIFLITLFIISNYEWYKLSLNKSLPLIYYLGVFFLFISFFSTYYLHGQNFESKIFFIWILSICIFSDLGGYFVGNIFGGKKLTKFSPNKTVSGSIGSFCFSLITSIFILLYILNLNDIDFKFILIILFFSLVSQIGDIVVSFFKRKKKIKDSGRLLPGHGGLLDRIDGMIFVMPIAAFFKYLQIY